MSTTFENTNFKNVVLNYLSGTLTTGSQLLYYANPYNGAQAANPGVAPSGTLEFGTYSQAISLVGKFSAADNNAAGFLAASAFPVTPAGAASVSSITNVRILNSAGAGVMDTSAAITPTAGYGIVLDSLTSSVGVGNIVNGMSIRMPLNNGGTLALSLNLAQRLVDLVTGAVVPSTTTIPQFGINTNGACTLVVYSGTTPATPETPITSQTALCSFTIPASQLWSAAAAGSLPMASTLTSVSAAATGTATFCRMTKTLGAMTFVIQGGVGMSGSPSDFMLNTTSIVSGSTYQMLDAVISL